MTDQVQTAGTSQNTGAEADAAAAAGAAAAANQQDTQSAAPAKDGQKPVEDAQGQGTPAATTAPEKYEFKAPEGATFDTEVLGEFEGVAKELGLSQENAQKVLDRVGPKIAARQVEAIKAQVEISKKAWTEEAKADTEFGGDALDENLGTAEKALEAFGTPKLRELLTQSGLSHHPEVVRFMFRAGKALAPDGKLVSGQPSGAAKTAKTFYSASNMNP